MELKNVHRIAILLVKYFRNELTAGEQDELERWKKRDVRNEELSRRVGTPVFMEECRREELAYDRERAYERFVKGQGRQAGRWITSWQAVAASVCVLIVSGWFLVQYAGKEDDAETPEVFAAGCSQVRLTLADGTSVELAAGRADTVKMNGMNLYTSGNELSYEDEVPSSESYNRIDVPRRGEYRIRLSDGTLVWINSGSALRFPSAFDSTERKVFLNGEAYFEVTRDSTRPFVVDMGAGQVEVLGTSFNVNCYGDVPFTYTTLAEGSVRLKSGSREVELVPGEQGVIDRNSGSLGKKMVDVKQYVSWKDGRFIFRRQSLGEIMSVVARWYDVEVVFADEELRKVEFSGNLERYDDFNRIVEMLEMTRRVVFKVDGSRILITK